MAVTEYDSEELSAVLLEYLKGAEHQYADIVRVMNKWLGRGDSVAVYENQDFGHPDQGDRKFTSYGSPQAQLEGTEPPKILPNIGRDINWRYCLIGTYKGEALEEPA